MRRTALIALKIAVSLALLAYLLSTTDLDHVERFAILVCSDKAGASILEASPPVR